MTNPQLRQKVFLPTELFLADPLLWLDTIEKYNVNQISVTNFGMALINDSLAKEPCRSWNLSCVKNLGIGAEAITPKIFNCFIQHLASFGLDPNVVYTGYGSTECGTVVTGKLLMLSNPIKNNYISLGKPCRGYSVRIVNDEGLLLDEEEIGNVQVKAPATTLGYYNDAEETKIYLP